MGKRASGVRVEAGDLAPAEPWACLGSWSAGALKDGFANAAENGGPDNRARGGIVRKGTVTGVIDGRRKGVKAELLFLI